MLHLSRPCSYNVISKAPVAPPGVLYDARSTCRARLAASQRGRAVLVEVWWALAGWQTSLAKSIPSNTSDALAYANAVQDS